MALNTAHANGGVLIHAGECILLFCDNVQMEFAGQVISSLCLYLVKRKPDI